MDLQPIQSIYAFLLSLFPPRYRAEFEDEMKAVFAEALTEAAAAGGAAVLVLILREVYDLPRLAFRERRRERRLPAYVPAHPPVAAAPPPRWMLAATVILFLAPAIAFTLAQTSSVGFAGAVTPALFITLAAGTIAVGRRGGFFPWSLPWVGLALGFTATHFIGRLATGLSGNYPIISVPSLNGFKELPSLPEWPWVSAGIYWASIGLGMILLRAVLALFPGLRERYFRLREDWTHISFMLYGAILPLLFDSEGYRYEPGFKMAAFLALTLGAGGYLRASGRNKKGACLLGGATLAIVLANLGGFILDPAQTWTAGSAANLPQAARLGPALGGPALWCWTMFALLAPWLVRRRPPMLLINLALCTLWLLLFRPVYPYLEIIFSRQEFRLNQLVLAGVIGLLIYQIRHVGLGFHFGSPPALHRPALAMLLGSSGMFILVERHVDINTLSASLFGLAFYGLLGLWLDAHRWRHGLPAALLLIGALPFGEHLQTFVGYPMRLLTAVMVRDGLATFGVHSIGVDTILVFENGVSQVDLPCSGVKSLWTGGMFLLAATWIESRRFNRRWLLAALVFAFLLFAANLARVAILITFGQVLGWRLLAEMLHVPLGVLGFCGACLALIWMLRRFVPIQSSAEVDGGAHTKLAHNAPAPRWLSPALFVSILALAALYSPRPDVAAAQAATPLTFPEPLSAEPWPFSPGEMAWLSADGPLSASRWRFQYDDYRGSLLLITSDTWRAHHRPERCFEAYGLTINQSRSLLLTTDFPVRLLTLGAGRTRDRATAIYWLQSSERVTDDYATRIWSDLAPNHRTWVLVTILFDERVNPQDPDLQKLYAGLRQSVARSLDSGGAQ